MSSTATAIADAQQSNFNPSWMRSTFHAGGGGSISASNRVSVSEDGADGGLSNPIFVKNRYGREELMALIGDPRVPEGLDECPFFVPTAQQPIVLYPLSELEHRMQQNINSSKAMSSLSHAERTRIADGGAYNIPGGAGGSPSSGGGGSGATARGTPSNSAGGWTSVKPWSARGGSNAQSTTSPSSGGVPRGISRPYVPARGGSMGRMGNSTPNGGPTDESTTPFGGQRFMASTRGRGTVPLARGGSTTAASFNTRAQGLYDPCDPKDRPRNRLRSTSEEGDGPTGTDSGWQAPKSAWNNRDNNRESARPEWMDDDDDGDKGQSSDDIPTGGAGSFDELGRFRSTISTVNNNHSQSTPSKSDIDERVAPASSGDAWKTGTTQTTLEGGSVEAPVTSAIRTRAMENPTTAAVSSSIQDQPINMNAYDSVSTSHQQPIYSRMHGPSQASIVSQQVMQAAPQQEPVEFFYLDPHKIERGPFTMDQMVAWFEREYFNDSLEVRKSNETAFRTLGELKRMNGMLTPFEYKDPMLQTQQPPMPVFGAAGGFNSMFQNTSVWQEAASNMMFNFNQPSPFSIDAAALERKRLEEEQQQRIRDEQQKIEEYKKLMMIEMQRQKDEVERQLREQQMALLKKQEEIARREREMQESAEEMKTRLEMERLQLEEKARAMDAEKVAKMEAERRALEARVAKEERLQEELRRVELRREEERRRKEEEDRQRRAEEAAEAERRRLRAAAEEAAEKIKQQQQIEKLNKERLVEEEQLRNAVAAATAAEAARQEEAAAANRMESVWGSVGDPTPHSFDDNEDDAWTTPAPVLEQKKKTQTQSKGAPWSAVGQPAPREKTLKEIQEEEERQMRAEKEQQAKLRKEDAASASNQNVLPTSGTWANASQKISWNQPVAAKSSSNSRPVAWGGAGLEPVKVTPSPYWDGPSLQAANRVQQPTVIKKPAAKAAPSARSTLKVLSTPTKTNENDPFLSWFVVRVKKLNESVDAEVLASFITAVENPDEVEDYLIGYLGDSKPVKEFTREFLHKRSEMRSRKNADKDDLSSASVAPATGTGSGGPAQQGKKKKSKGTRLVVDGACLGFRATSDPNRVNQGEIETVGLAPGQKR